MRAFYFESETGETITSQNPMELSYAECRRILNRLRVKGSFLGVLLDENCVLQIMSEGEGLFWMEILDRPARVAEGCKVNMPIAELALEAAARGMPIKPSLSKHFLDWKMEGI